MTLMPAASSRTPAPDDQVHDPSLLVARVRVRDPAIIFAPAPPIGPSFLSPTIPRWPAKLVQLPHD